MPNCETVMPTSTDRSPTENWYITASSRSSGAGTVSATPAKRRNGSSVPTTEMRSPGMKTVSAFGALIRWLPRSRETTVTP